MLNIIRTSSCLALFVWLAPVTIGYRMYADLIPNGIQIPHPCKPNILWHGVGHFNVDGGGFRNPFGQDFSEAGKQWTEALCRKDSDGDGRTNGEELGDPNCVWKAGQIPKLTQNLSHPGICDPINSPACQQKKFSVGLFHNQEEWMEDACKSSEFDCPAIQSSDVRIMPAHLPATSVPAKETTYICRIFQVEDIENDYHMIAATPIVNNSYILHHIVLFGCTDDVPVRDVFECNMLPHRNCNSIVTSWTLGLNGDCFHPDAGVLLGKNGLKKLAIQLHWNNPSRIGNYVDSSGLKLHYTSRRRHYDSAIYLVGHESFSIPPLTKSTLVKAKCSSGCTRQIIHRTIYFTSAFNHMHYLGRKMKIEQFRNGTLLRELTNDQTYSYDSPKFYSYSTPIAVEPGDELITTCEYSSQYKTTTTYFGESTSQEMCFGFLRYHPVQNTGRSMCLTHERPSRCDLSIVG